MSGASRHLPGHRHRASRQAGITLVEVLVTLLLVSTGLLGMVALQLSTTQNTNSAAQRFEATQLARDILERMRANRAAAMLGHYNVALGGSSAAGGLAKADVDEWKAALARLPGGDGAVAVVDGVATITVAWTDVSTDNVPAEGEEEDDRRAVSVFLRTDL
jgi:type IV pilus assembly protein PilV